MIRMKIQKVLLTGITFALFALTGQAFAGDETADLAVTAGSGVALGASNPLSTRQRKMIVEAKKVSVSKEAEIGKMRMEVEELRPFAREGEDPFRRRPASMVFDAKESQLRTAEASQAEALRELKSAKANIRARGITSAASTALLLGELLSKGHLLERLNSHSSSAQINETKEKTGASDGISDAEVERAISNPSRIGSGR